jgi:hypothetical protein
MTYIVLQNIFGANPNELLVPKSASGDLYYNVDQPTLELSLLTIKAYPAYFAPHEEVTVDQLLAAVNTHFCDGTVWTPAVNDLFVDISSLQLDLYQITDTTGDNYTYRLVSSGSDYSDQTTAKTGFTDCRVPITFS